SPSRPSRRRWRVLASSSSVSRASSSASRVAASIVSGSPSGAAAADICPPSEFLPCGRKILRFGRKMSREVKRTRSEVGRRRAAHLGPERRRPLVLDAALGLFVERGYRGTAMEAIAEAAGVTKPVVYECYPSKAELFRALLEREEGRLLEAVAT